MQMLSTYHAHRDWGRDWQRLLLNLWDWKVDLFSLLFINPTAAVIWRWPPLLGVSVPWWREHYSGFIFWIDVNWELNTVTFNVSLSGFLHRHELSVEYQHVSRYFLTSLLSLAFSFRPTGSFWRWASSKAVHEYIVSLFRYLQLSSLINCAFAGDYSQFFNYSQKLGSILAAVTVCVWLSRNKLVCV